jgi:hypothetical protein
MPMTAMAGDWRKRLLEERAGLAERRSDLAVFVESKPFHDLTVLQQSWLRIQLHHMEGYEHALNERLKAGDIVK